MRNNSFLRRSLATTVMVALTISTPAPLFAAGSAEPQRATVRVGQPANSQRPTREVQLSLGEGEMVTLPTNVSTVWTSNPEVADVYVTNAHQINLFGKKDGEATIFATTASGAVVYAANVRVSQNLTSIDRMLKAAMPEADIHVTTVGQLAVLNGTVASPQDSAQAEKLVLSLLNPGVNVSDPAAMLKMGVVNRLRNATPLQVNLQVRFAEVSRSFVKNIGVNLLTRDTTSGFQFSVQSGAHSPGTIGYPDLSHLPVLDASSRFGFPAGTLSLPYDPVKGDFVYPNTGSAYTFSKGSELTSLGAAGKLFGLDILSALDLGETMGMVSTLTNPNLTALSGETGSFLAGGEIPIPVSQGLGAVSVEYKQYGVSLAYTPTVLSDGRISLRVRPEVSQLSAAGAVTLSGVQIPALTTRRAETTVELGSGESFMIAGLLQNSHDNTIDKAPGVGDLPVLGALFRSNAWKRNESELVIVITPYLVKPVNANQIVLPTDGYKGPDDFSRVLLGTLGDGNSGEHRPVPTMAPPAGAAPALGAAATVPPAPVQAPAPGKFAQQPVVAAPPPAQPKKAKGDAAPGFSN